MMRFLLGLSGAGLLRAAPRRARLATFYSPYRCSSRFCTSLPQPEISTPSSCSASGVTACSMLERVLDVACGLADAPQVLADLGLGDGHDSSWVWEQDCSE